MEVGHAPINPILCDDVGVIGDEYWCVFPFIAFDELCLVVEIFGCHDGLIVCRFLVRAVKETHHDAPHVFG